MTVRSRPAFYALESGGWRDYVTLLHPPYTLWHLSYVAIGASLAPGLQAHRLVWGLLAFLLAMGVGAHALDELNGRPLGTRIPAWVLIAVAIISISAATAIGVGAAIAWTLWLVPCVVFGAFIAVAYTLELVCARLGRLSRAYGLCWRQRNATRGGAPGGALRRFPFRRPAPALDPGAQYPSERERDPRLACLQRRKRRRDRRAHTPSRSRGGAASSQRLGRSACCCASRAQTFLSGRWLAY
jgi:hypothetical protein